MSSGSEPTRLDPDKILVAALAVADREGLAGMTMRQVGAELGADPTALYRHFPSKNELVAAMADRLFAGLLEGPLPDDWRGRVAHFARGGRLIYKSHGTLVQALSVQPEDSPSLV